MGRDLVSEFKCRNDGVLIGPESSVGLPVLVASQFSLFEVEDGAGEGGCFFSRERRALTAVRS